MKIVVVEPEAAPALFSSIETGMPVNAAGPASIMGRLDRKEPSHLALKYLAREADAFALITEREGEDAAARLDDARMTTTPRVRAVSRDYAEWHGRTCRRSSYVSEAADA